MNEYDKAYLAGLIDGEGSISCGIQRSGVPQMFIAIGMCDEGVLKWIQSEFGGCLYEVKNKRAHW